MNIILLLLVYISHRGSRESIRSTVMMAVIAVREFQHRDPSYTSSNDEDRMKQGTIAGLEEKIEEPKHIGHEQQDYLARSFFQTFQSVQIYGCPS